MDRRKFLGVSGAALAAGLAGCTEAFGQSEADAFDNEHTKSGGLIAENVDDIPDDATVVDATTGRLGSIDAVQTILDRVTDDDRAYALLSLDTDTFKTVRTALDGIPYYEGEGVDGHYLRYDGGAVVLYQYFRA